VINQFKTVLLLGALTGLFLGIGYFFGPSGLTIALIMALVMNLISYFFAHKIVLFMYRAKEADKTKYKGLYRDVKQVSELANLPMPKVYIVPTNAFNAFATGRNPKHSVVAVTEGILELLTEKELKGVIAHEISHIRNRDILIGTIAAVIAGAISYIAFMARWGAIFGGDRDRGGGNIIGLLLLGIITPIIALIIQLAISRSREYLADNTGARLIKDPDALASALIKLHDGVKQNPLKFGSESTAHMFIVCPFNMKGVMSILSTHPSVTERVKRLKAIKF